AAKAANAAKVIQRFVRKRVAAADDDASSIASDESDYHVGDMVKFVTCKGIRYYISKRRIGAGSGEIRVVYKLLVRENKQCKYVLKVFRKPSIIKKGENKKSAILREVQTEVGAFDEMRRILAPLGVLEGLEARQNYIIYERGVMDVKRLIKDYLPDICQARGNGAEDYKRRLILRLIRDYLEIVIAFNEGKACHNDLHRGNVMLTKDKGFVAIDPELMVDALEGQFVDYRGYDNENRKIIKRNHPANVVLKIINDFKFAKPPEEIKDIKTAMEGIFAREKDLDPTKKTVQFPEGHHKQTYDAIQGLLNDEAIWKEAMTDDELRRLSKEIRCRQKLSELKEKIKELLKKSEASVDLLALYIKNTPHERGHEVEKDFRTARENIKEALKTHDSSSPKRLKREYHELRESYDRLKECREDVSAIVMEKIRKRHGLS
ncbi:MAG: hypothetical protein AAF621_04445, partial [Pseudomonadota bacterium]